MLQSVWYSSEKIKVIFKNVGAKVTYFLIYSMGTPVCWIYVLENT